MQAITTHSMDSTYNLYLSDAVKLYTGQIEPWERVARYENLDGTHQSLGRKIGT